MLVVLINESRAMAVLRADELSAQRGADGLYTLEGSGFKLDLISPAQALALPDGTEIEEGGEITEALQSLALSFDLFLCPTKEQATADALGLVMRAAVAQGRITDEELLRMAAALDRREWRSGLAVEVGDVYAFVDCLWRCITRHTTQQGWQPDKTPALWRKVEIVSPDAPRVWQTQTDYIAGDVVRYPGADSPAYRCVQGHMSQAGWEPPNVPALWALVDDK